jgi:RNA polymerase sigma-70 factor (ECF subfamily)
MSEAMNLTPAGAAHDLSGTVARDAGVFATTQWSVVMCAGAAATAESKAALDRLCRQYWQPLYYFIRRRGYNEQDAQDLTQGFFARLLEKDSIGAADRERGRFRTFLLAGLGNYLANEWDRASRQKRGGGGQFLSLDLAEGAETGYQLLPVDTDSPDRLYDRRWAQAVLEAVLGRLREEFERRHGNGRFDVLKQFLFYDQRETSYADAAGRLGLSEPATKSAIYRLRQRYGVLFAEEIAQTVEKPEEVDDEIRHLLAALESG